MAGLVSRQFGWRRWLVLVVVAFIAAGLMSVAGPASVAQASTPSRSKTFPIPNGFCKVTAVAPQRIGEPPPFGTGKFACSTDGNKTLAIKFGVRLYLNGAKDIGWSGTVDHLHFTKRVDALACPVDDGTWQTRVNFMGHIVWSPKTMIECTP